MTDKTNVPKGHDAKVPELLRQIDELQNQVLLLTEALQRERADAVNIRRRFEDQLADVRDSAKVALVVSLLPVIDNFERSLKHMPKDLESNEYVKGVANVVKQFDKFLENLGVQHVETVGREFDPQFHEAVSMEEGDGAKEVVSEELQAGYKLNDTVIRHAMVRVKPQ